MNRFVNRYLLLLALLPTTSFAWTSTGLISGYLSPVTIAETTNAYAPDFYRYKRLGCRFISIPENNGWRTYIPDQLKVRIRAQSSSNPITLTLRNLENPGALPSVTATKPVGSIEPYSPWTQHLIVPTDSYATGIWEAFIKGKNKRIVSGYQMEVGCWSTSGKYTLTLITY
jgi:hypothetical protein